MFEKSILDLMASVTDTPVEELKRQQQEQREYEESDEFQAIIEANQKKEEAERKKRYQEEIKKNYPTDELIKPTKTNLNKIVQWSSSKFNDYRKAEVVGLIFASIQGGNDTIDEYSCGTYSEATGGRGVGDYKLVIYQGVAKLIVNEGWDKEYQRVYEFTK